MLSIIKKLLTDNSGATAIEYGLLVAFIAIAIMASLTSVGHSVSDTMSTVDQGMDRNESQSVG